MITSTKNPALKELRRLRRRAGRDGRGLFLAEGEDLISAAQSAGWRPRSGFRVPGTDAGGEEFLEVSAEALAAASTLGSGARAIGVYEQRLLERPVGPLCVYLHGVSDPGNIGTVLRGALAFGASFVALGPGCADPYSPKAVRASMGAIFAVPLGRVDEIALLPGELVALVPHRGEALENIEAEELTLLVGAERDGLPTELVQRCERVAQIPIACESLNAAMAATIALYEMSRPRTRGTDTWRAR